MLKKLNKLCKLFVMFDNTKRIKKFLLYSYIIVMSKVVTNYST